MTSHNRPVPALVALLIGSSLAAASTQAAVVVQSKTRVDGTGLMAMAAMTATSGETIDGDRARIETRIAFDSGVVKMLARAAAGEQVEIVRLDRDRIYQVEPGKQRYVERSLADARAQLAQVQSQVQGKPGGPPVAFDDSQCEWSPASSSATRDGRERIAGLDAERWLIRASQTCTDRQTRQRCDLVLESRLALGDGTGLAAESRRFHERYAQALGLAAAGSRTAQERAKAMFGRYDGLWSESVGRLAALQGQALRLQFSLGVGGAECGAAAALPDATTAATGAPSTGDVGREMATVATSTAVTEKTGRWRIGDLSGQLVGGLLAKRRKAPGEGPVGGQGASGAAPGLRPLVSVSYEVVSIDATSVPAETFEVPAGYKLAKTR